jgi:hypothetical protein
MSASHGWKDMNGETTASGCDLGGHMIVNCADVGAANTIYDALLPGGRLWSVPIWNTASVWIFLKARVSMPGMWETCNEGKLYRLAGMSRRG